MDFEKFVNKYKPIKNHIEEDATYDRFVFETCGEELGFVIEKAKENPLKVCTIIECEDKRYIS